MRFWITFTDGTLKQFTVPTRDDALEYFMMEGDHALNYGQIVDGHLLDSSAAEQAPHTGQRGGSIPPLATN